MKAVALGTNVLRLPDWTRLKLRLFGHKKLIALLEDIDSLTKDGLTLNKALDLMLEYPAAQDTLPVVRAILATLDAGEPLPNALVPWYPPTVVEVLRAGWDSGTFPQALESAIAAMRDSNKILGGVIKHFAYPAFVAVAFTVFVGFFAGTIYPEWERTLPVAKWPDIGRYAYALTHFLLHWGWTVLAGLVGLVYGTAYTLRHYTGPYRHYIDNAPLLRAYRYLTAARLMKQLAVLSGHGITVRRAVNLLRRHASPYLDYHLRRIDLQLGMETDVAGALDTGLILPGQIARLRAIANTSNFDTALVRMASHAEEAAHAEVDRAAKFTAWALVFLLAAGIALMALTMYAVPASFAQIH